MAASFIGNSFKKKAPPRSIEKAFLGRLCERAAGAHCRGRGWRVLQTNWRYGIGEIDLLAEDGSGRWVIVEVRGYRRSGRPPSRYLSTAKKRRLLQMASLIAARYRRAVRVELVEVTGFVPRSRVGRLLLHGLSRWVVPGFECRSRGVSEENLR